MKKKQMMMRVKKRTWRARIVQRTLGGTQPYCFAWDYFCEVRTEGNMIVGMEQRRGNEIRESTGNMRRFGDRFSQNILKDKEEASCERQAEWMRGNAYTQWHVV